MNKPDTQPEELLALSPTSIWSREIPLQSIVNWTRNHAVELIMGAGILFRVAGYLSNRGYWMDEVFLIGCIEDLGRTGLFGELGLNQLAPPGFLGLEWLAIQLVGASPFGFRLVPLIAGIASMFLFRAIARQCLSFRGELAAVTLFAVADDLIYFASEVKQYSSDLALSLLCLKTAFDINQAPKNAIQIGGLAVLGGTVVWFSHPSIFTLAAIGTVGLTRAVAKWNWRAAASWLGVGTVWITSFAAVHAVAMHQLGYRRDMWDFWEFAFPPIPPQSFGELIWPIRRLLFLFASPLNFDAPFGPGLSIWPAVLLTLVGGFRMFRTAPNRLAWLLLPGGFALIAAYGRLYPFHGRLLLFFAPVLLVLIASGFDTIRHRTLRWVFGVWVIGFPTLTAIVHLVEPRQRDTLNPYGDRRPASLDPYWFPLAAPGPPEFRKVWGEGS